MLRAVLAIGPCGASYDWRSFTSFGIKQLFYGSNFIDRIIYSLSLALIQMFCSPGIKIVTLISGQLLHQ